MAESRIDIAFNALVNNGGFTQVERHIESVKKNLKELSNSGSSIEFPEQLIDVKLNDSEFRKQIQFYETELTKLQKFARAAFEAGSVTAGLDFNRRAGEISNLVDQMKGLDNATKDNQTSIKGFLGGLNNLGFQLFIFQSSIQTIIGLFDDFYNAALEGAELTSRQNNFERLFALEGVDTNRLTDAFEEASQGAVKMDVAYAKALQLIKAGQTDIAANSDALLEIAVNSALLSGELGKTSEIYEKLIRGIVRGSPQLIDDADIILKVGDANERYAASLGKTVEELTRAEQIQATFNAVMEEGERINALAEGADKSALAIKELGVQAEESFDMLKQQFAEVVLEGIEATKPFQDYVDSLIASESGWENYLGVVLKSFTTLKGFVSIVSFIARGVIKGMSLASTVTDTFRDSLFGALKLIYDIAEAVFLLEDTSRGVVDAWSRFTLNAENIRNNLDQGINDFKTGMQELTNMTAEGFGMEVPTVEFEGGSTAGLFEEEVDAVQESANEMAQIIEDNNNALRDLAKDRASKLRDAAQDYRDELVDIDQDLADKLADISRDLNDKLKDLSRERGEELADAARDYHEKLLEAEQDYSEEMESVRTDAEDDRIKAREEYNETIQDIEEDHQKKLRDIMLKFERSRFNALVDRDARALIEAEQQRDDALSSLEDDTEEKTAEELEDLQDKLDEINKKEQQATEDAEKERKKRLDELKRDMIRERQEINREYETRRQEARRDAERQRQEAQLDAERSRRDAAIERDRETRDIQDWYRDELDRQRDYFNDKLKQESEYYNSSLSQLGDYQNAIDSGNAGSVIETQRDPYTPTITQTVTPVGYDPTRDPGTTNVFGGQPITRAQLTLKPGADTAAQRFIEEVFLNSMEVVLGD